MVTHLTAEQRQLALRLRARGLSLRQIGPQVGCSHELVRIIARGGPSRPQRRIDPWVPGPGRLTLADREEISLGLHAGEAFAVIAARLGKATSTVSREVAGNGGRAGYRAWRAHQRARERARRPKVPKLACPRLAAQVTGWLEAWWSPQEISARLRIEFAGDPMMQVSHETIYQALFVQGRGELRRELARCLRTGRAKRRSRHRPENTGRIKDMVMISERPAEACRPGRARPLGRRPDHRQGLQVSGRHAGRAQPPATSCCCTCPTAAAPSSVDAAMRQAIATLPGELFRTLTWDQGKEMAYHAQFTIATGIQVYFCDPHKPWQRGSNENTNGLLRQYLPKGTDLSAHSAEDIARIARSLNNRPRKTLGYMKPSEKLAELLAHTG